MSERKLRVLRGGKEDDPKKGAERKGRRFLLELGVDAVQKGQFFSSFDDLRPDQLLAHLDVDTQLDLDDWRPVFEHVTAYGHNLVIVTAAQSFIQRTSSAEPRLSHLGLKVSSQIYFPRRLEKMDYTPLTVSGFTTILRRPESVTCLKDVDSDITRGLSTGLTSFTFHLPRPEALTAQEIFAQSRPMSTMQVELERLRNNGSPVTDVDAEIAEIQKWIDGPQRFSGNLGRDFFVSSYTDAELFADSFIRLLAEQQKNYAAIAEAFRISLEDDANSAARRYYEEWGSPTTAGLIAASPEAQQGRRLPDEYGSIVEYVRTDSTV